jgi:TPR repeat protein
MDQNRTLAVILAVAMVVAAIAGVMYFVVDPSTDSALDADRGDEARQVVADLEESGPADYQQAYERAQEFQREGRLADAQLLYFYAARGGHAQSELALATMNDPNHHSAETSLLSEPDPFQAYKWYSAALEHGATSASARLEELHEWAKEAAADGDLEAERLLLQWQ